MQQGVTTVCDLMPNSRSQQEKLQSNRPSPTKKFRMPSLLRLNSTGEITSSSHIPSAASSNLNSKPVPIIKSGAPCSSFTPCDTSQPPSTKAKVSDYKWLPPTIMASTAAKLFSPHCHSTPTFMKSKSFPETSTMMEGIQLRHLNSSLSNGHGGNVLNHDRSINLNRSTQKMKPNEVFAERTLSGSLSTPTLWKKDLNPDPERLMKPFVVSHNMFSDKMDKLHGSTPTIVPESTIQQANCDVSGKRLLVPKTETHNSSDVPSPIPIRNQRICQKTPRDEKESNDESQSPCAHSNSFEQASWTTPSFTNSTLYEDESDLSCPTTGATTSEKSKEEHDKDRSFVLFRERKCTKKGRPSGKKQRKRNREKLNVKQSPEYEPNSSEPSVVFSITVNDDRDECDNKLKKLHVSLSNDSISFVDDTKSTSVGQSVQRDFDISFSPAKEVSAESFSELNSSPSRSAQSKLACIFISGANVESDDESDSHSSQDDDGWSSDEGMENPDNFSGNFSGFGLALSLDAIFKKKELPSLKSVLQESEGDSTSGFSTSSPNNSLTLFVGSPSNSSLEDSICFSSLPESDSIDLTPSSPVAQSMIGALAEFSQGLCLDSIFSGGGVPITSQHDVQQASSPGETESESRLREINANWDEHYRTAGYRTCNSNNPVISNPAIKVCFVDGSGLVTVYEVGTEERRGKWENFVLDRQRFARRIQEVSSVLDPILDSKHRERVQERNARLTENVPEI